MPLHYVPSYQLLKRSWGRQKGRFIPVKFIEFFGFSCTRAATASEGGMLRNVICTGRIMLCLLLLNGPFTSKTGQRRRVHARLAEDPYSSKSIDLRPRCHTHLHACQPHISNSRFWFVVARTQSYLPERGADFERVLVSTASR
jgi:hypothetical protein